MPRGVPRKKSEDEQSLRQAVNSFLKKGGVSRKSANAIHEAVEAVVERAKQDAMQQFEDDGEGGGGEPVDATDPVQVDTARYATDD